MNIIKEHIKPRVEQRLVQSSKNESGDWVNTYADYQVNAYVCIRSNCYGSQLSFILKLVKEALQDFPFIKEEDIEIIHLGGGQEIKVHLGLNLLFQMIQLSLMVIARFRIKNIHCKRI
jgi:hypothetical protein